MNRLWLGLWAAVPLALADCATAGEQVEANRVAEISLVSDIAPFAYTYRKGAANNPMETRWLNPTPELLCGLLWEERRSVRRIEVVFPADGTAPSGKQLRLVTRSAAAPFEEASAPGFGLGPQQGVYAQARCRSDRYSPRCDHVYLRIPERH